MVHLVVRPIYEAGEWIQMTIYTLDSEAKLYRFIPGDDDYIRPYYGYMIYSYKDGIRIQCPKK